MCLEANRRNLGSLPRRRGQVFMASLQRLRPLLQARRRGVDTTGSPTTLAKVTVLRAMESLQEALTAPPRPSGLPFPTLTVRRDDQIGASKAHACSMLLSQRNPGRGSRRQMIAPLSRAASSCGPGAAPRPLAEGHPTATALEAAGLHLVLSRHRWRRSARIRPKSPDRPPPSVRAARRLPVVPVPV